MNINKTEQENLNNSQSNDPYNVQEIDSKKTLSRSYPTGIYPLSKICHTSFIDIIMY